MKYSRGMIPSPLQGYRHIGTTDRWLVYATEPKDGYMKVKLVESSLKPCTFKSNYWLTYILTEQRWVRCQEMEKASRYLSRTEIGRIESIVKRLG